MCNDFGMSRPGIEPVTSRSPERALYQLSYQGRYITTDSHQLKMRFLFAIVYKNGLFQILGFSSYQKEKKNGMLDTYQKFCQGRPAYCYCAAHDFRPFTKKLFSIVMWIRLYENGIFATRENTALIRSTTLQKINYPLYL